MIAQAQATRDADIEKAKALEQRDQVVFKTEEDITRKQNARDMQKQANQKEINTQLAIANNATRAATAELDKILINEKMQIELVEKRGDAKVMDEQLKLTEQKLICEMKLNAEAKQYVTIKNAEAAKTKINHENAAAAMEIEAIGDAQAEVIRLKSQAEAKALTLKALAYEQYGKAALVGEVIKTMPRIAAEIAGPIENMNKMTIVSSGDGQIGFSRITSEVMHVMNECPNSVNQMTGIDLRAEIQKVMMAN